jgi:hypothetical protein
VSATLTCALCATAFTPPPIRRGGKPRVYCGKPCQTQAANARRVRGRANLSTAVKPAGQPLAPEATTIPPTVDMAASDARNARISALMTLAHSRGGIDPWQVAELAKLKGISPWAPLRVILGHEK